MNYQTAINILELNENNDTNNNININNLKKQYHKMALKNHPDKNGNTSDSKEHFQQINEAYHFLENILIEDNDENEEHDEDENNKERENENVDSSLYLNILKEFMKSFFNNYATESASYKNILFKIVGDILNKGKKLSFKIFDEIDKDAALNIYLFLNKYYEVLHLKREILDLIKEIVVKKFDTVEIYKLNPTIDDLLNNNFYKLTIRENLLFVPLWHSESYYDISGCEIVVLCEPELPEHISIDDDNNICINMTIPFSFSFSNDVSHENISLFLGEKELFIPIEQLYIKKKQIYKFCNQGISKIKKNVYDILERNDIIINIIFI